MDSGHLLEEAVQERAGKYDIARTSFKSVKKNHRFGNCILYGFELTSVEYYCLNPEM